MLINNYDIIFFYFLPGIVLNVVRYLEVANKQLHGLNEGITG